MPGAITICIVSDTVTASLRSAMRADTDTRSVMEAVGEALVGITKRAFSDAALCAAPWPPRKKQIADHVLRKSCALGQSIRVESGSHDNATIGSDRR